MNTGMWWYGYVRTMVGCTSQFSHETAEEHIYMHLLLGSCPRRIDLHVERKQGEK